MLLLIKIDMAGACLPAPLLLTLDRLLVARSNFEQPGKALVALGGDAKALWTTKCQSSVISCATLAVLPSGKQFALGFQGGRGYVVDVASGPSVREVTGQGANLSVCWVVHGDVADNLLLVSTQDTVNAFRVKPSAASPRNHWS